MLTKESIDLSNQRINKSVNLLEQSKVLLENEMFDGSINRSYYSIFFSIRSILGLVNLDSSKHSGVLALFDKYFVKTRIFNKEFSKIAHTAFDIRQDSDYDDFFYPVKEEANNQFQNAKKFVEEADKIRFDIINGKINLPAI